MRRSGSTPVWAFVVGGLFVLAGLWALLNGIACAALLRSVGPSSPSSPSPFCGTYEWGGALLLVLGIALPIGVLLASRHGRGTSGRAIREPMTERRPPTDSPGSGTRMDGSR
jgi:hypothetical protein